VLLLNILSDTATATHSVKMIDEAFVWSDAGLDVRFYLSY